jgi:hypothetical protein
MDVSLLQGFVDSLRAMTDPFDYTTWIAANAPDAPTVKLTVMQYRWTFTPRAEGAVESMTVEGQTEPRPTASCTAAQLALHIETFINIPRTS